MENLSYWVDHYSQPKNRLTGSFLLEEIVTPVFPEDQVKSSFVGAVRNMIQSGAQVKFGGRRLRDLLGCRVDNRAGHVRGHDWDTHPHQAVRLAYLLDELRNYPDEAMARDDLDFFVDHTSLSQITSHLVNRGINSHIHFANGNVPIINIETEHGSCSFIHSHDSWQTKDVWPPYAAKAPLKIENDQVVASYDLGLRFHCFPLKLPGVEFLPEDAPIRAAAVCRGLLYLVTAKLPPTYARPEGQPMPLPNYRTRDSMLKTIFAMGKIASQANLDQSIHRRYRGALKDLSVALMVILDNGLDQSDYDSPFYYQAVNFCLFGMIEQDKLKSKE